MQRGLYRSGRPVKQYSTKFGKKYASIGQIFHLKKGMECDMITRFKTAETARFLFCEKRLFFMPRIEIY